MKIRDTQYSIVTNKTLFSVRLLEDPVKLYLYSLPWRLDGTFSDTKFQRNSPKWITQDCIIHNTKL